MKTHGGKRTGAGRKAKAEEQKLIENLTPMNPLALESLQKGLPTCVSKGYLVSQKNGVTRIFTDYIKTKDKPTFDSIGNTTIIPTAVIQSIKKLN